MLKFIDHTWFVIRLEPNRRSQYLFCWTINTLIILGSIFAVTFTVVSAIREAWM